MRNVIFLFTQKLSKSINHCLTEWIENVDAPVKISELVQKRILQHFTAWLVQCYNQNFDWIEKNNIFMGFWPININYFLFLDADKGHNKLLQCLTLHFTLESHLWSYMIFWKLVKQNYQILVRNYYEKYAWVFI